MPYPSSHAETRGEGARTRTGTTDAFIFLTGIAGIMYATPYHLLKLSPLLVDTSSHTTLLESIRDDA